LLLIAKAGLRNTKGADSEPRASTKQASSAVHCDGIDERELKEF